MDEPRHDAPSAGNKEEQPAPSPQLSLWPAEELRPEVSGSADDPSATVVASQAEPAWTLSDLGLFVFLAAACVIVVVTLTASVFKVLQRDFHWHISLEEALNDAPLAVSVQTLLELLWLICIYLIVTTRSHRPFWQAIKWCKPRQGTGTYLTAGMLLAIAAQFVLNQFPSPKPLPIEKLFSSTQAAYALAFFGICFAPFAEEVLFRGFIYPVFERLWGLLPGVVLTGLLFAGAHYLQLRGGWPEIAGIFVVGMVFSYCRGKTRSLVPPYLMHVSYNTSLFVWLYFSTDRFRHLNG
jgi:membrane protease YdiL (CAAX protease family)